MTVVPQPTVMATLYALATMILTSGQIHAQGLDDCRLSF
jgi:hypothetical protein